MSKEEQWVISEAVEKSFARMQRGYLRRRIIIITFLVLLFLMLAVIGFILYVNYWPDNLYKGTQFFVELDETFLKSELARLEPLKENYDYEVMYENGGDKALLVMFGAADGVPIRERFPLKVDNEYVFYYEFDDIGAEACYDSWASSCKRDMIKYDLPFYPNPKNDMGNLYAFFYGEEAAKGKPNYQFSTFLMFEMNGNSHHLHVFCNSQDFLPVLITRFVDEINALNA